MIPAAALLLALGVLARPSQAAAQAAPAYLPGVVIVGYQHRGPAAAADVAPAASVSPDGSDGLVQTKLLHLRRGVSVGRELRALRRLAREQEPKSAFVFASERGAPFTTAGFARMIERLGEAASLGFKPHPHMLRHACGFALANKGHDTRALQGYLGHRNIQHTVRYTELSPDRFKDFWR